MSIDLTPTRQNMLENMIKFLNDDCYVYIMTTGLDEYNKVADKCDFYTFIFGLTEPFRERIVKLYEALNTEDPTNAANEMYTKSVKSAIERIQQENHSFSIGINMKNSTRFEIVFLKKKIEPSVDVAI
jgi:hypothetical protein